MTAPLFSCGTLLVAAAIMIAACRHLPAAMARAVVVGLPLWLVYVGLLSWTGTVGNVALRPPGVVYIVLPAFLFIILVVARSTRGARVAVSLPLGLLMGAQVFRLAVELVLHQLWREGLVPRLMTYEGGNFDIVIGFTAPIIAWLATDGPTGRRLALVWNTVGLLALANIVARSALTAPGPLHLVHSEVPNLAIGTFPYTFIAGFFVPLAVLLHALSIRRLLIPRPKPLTRIHSAA